MSWNVIYGSPTGSVDTPRQPSAAALALAGFAPSLIRGTVLQPSAAALALAGLSPTLASAFSTTFPNTENPVSLGGLVKQGLADGVDWSNTQSTAGSPGSCYATAFNDSTDNDSIMWMPGVFSTTKHYSQITIHKAAGYTAPSTHEVECHVGTTGSAHSIKSYEMDFGIGLNLQPVRWDGAINAFTTNCFTVLSGNFFSVADGDVVKTVFDSSSGSPVITVFLNGVQQIQMTDTTAGKLTTGAPGVGFFIRSGTGADFTKYCISGWACGNA